MFGREANQGSTGDRSNAVVLDITRLVSRVGRGPFTGVDRVELAYLEWCLATDASFHTLARLADGYAVLDRGGTETFYEKLIGDLPWGERDLRARLGWKTPEARGRVEADLRRLAILRSGKGAVPTLPAGIYLNVGHSNLTKQTLSSIADQERPIAVLVHDMIPLDFPHFQRPGSSDLFEKKMKVVAENADLIIANSIHTEERTRAYFDEWSHPVQKAVTAHLGVPTISPRKHEAKRPYLCTIGTIEPRKNHALLLDVWDQIPDDEKPDLYIIGQRGWNNEALFSRLNGLRGSAWLHERNDMADEEVLDLLAGSHGLLFPSFAEGFGLPSLEAASLGVPVICGDLAIHREVLGDYPVYAGLEDRYLWKKTILEQARQRQKDLVHASRAKTVKIPTWSEHFETVNTALKSLG